ncbi:MAG TPA: sensor histidine kinase, partial [Epsilonproteobacteria bacterium]|nr:sensor histidine kinase [Campylobacterota bacterium]
ASFYYLLMDLHWGIGAIFGGVLGFTITLFSLLFISTMNQSILPRIPETFWMPVAVFFSFLSGFLGTEATLLVSNLMGLPLIPLFDSHGVQISAIIGFLTYIVGALLYRFVKMRNEKELVDRHYIDSRLGSLERQLNPHFLFNALNSIAELVHQDPDKAERAILQVSSFLRNTMNEKPLIPLEEEIKNLKAYVEVENIRFAGRVQLHLPNTVASVSVPKFSLQMIVENAIKHGMISGKPMEITIAYLPEENAVTIQNNGKPIEKTDFGIGLSNLNERLQLLCKGKLKVTQTDIPCYTLYLGACNENTDRR